MSVNGSSGSGCKLEVRPSNNTCIQQELSVTASVISMTVGIFSNGLALFILLKSYTRARVKSKASFLLFASSLVVTDLLGHIVNGSLVLVVYSSHKNWEKFDPHHVMCIIFGACMVFFGLSPLFIGGAMAVERCIGITMPIFHSTAVASYPMKRLLGLTLVGAALVAMLPVVMRRPYKVQSSRSWCFFHMEELKDWRDVLPPLLFSLLGLLALLLSIVCNTVTSCTLMHARLRHKNLRRSTLHHIEMICQLLVIMVVSCVCWGPLLFHIIILSTRAKDKPESVSLLMAVRMATWNQILDPWVYILLRKAVLRKIFMLLNSCWGPKFHHLYRWQQSFLGSSVKTSNSEVGLAGGGCHGVPLQNTGIKSIT